MEAEREGVALLAGGIAQQLFAPGHRLGNEWDELRAKECACVVLGSGHGVPLEAERAKLDEWKQWAETLLRVHRQHVEALARELILRPTIAGVDVVGFLNAIGPPAWQPKTTPRSS